MKSDENMKKETTGVTRNVLVVDNEQDTVVVLSQGLVRMGFKVSSYTSANKLIVDFRPNEFDLLLTDIQMPEMGGYELYRKLHDVDSAMKVCFLTGHNEYSNEFRTFFPKMDEKCFVNKPASISHLADRISSIIDS